MAHPLIERLSRGPVLADGAMGTMLYARSGSFDEHYDQFNLTHPELVSAIHREYIAAGADLIETNTFGANRYKLESIGLADQVTQINKRAAKLAREEREVAGTSTIIAGAIGSTMRSLEPFGLATRAEIRDAFREQIEALLEGGVDCLIFETFGNIDELEEALTAARQSTDLPVLAMMTFAEDGLTVGGSTVRDVIDRLSTHRVDVFGANCSVGPSKLLPVVKSMRRELKERSIDWQLAAMPNAGWPTTSGGRVVYTSAPDYFANFARDAVNAGIRLIGGCCGTTPDHVRAMRAAIDETTDTVSANGHEATGRRSASQIREIAAQEGPTKLGAEMGSRFLVSVEIDPPKGLNPEKALDGARLLKEAGVDAINVADSPMARVRMSALTLCYLIQHEIGIETIVHFTTRDRSLMGLQSELLGAHAAGVRNILALTGDPPALGNYPGSSAVFDVDSIGLIRVLGQLNSGVDSAGASIGRQASFSIACAVDPTKRDLEDEARRLHAKLDAGAHWVMTQPIYDLKVWTDFLDVFGGPIPVPVMIGIL
ncbi:MAG: bifunctional homocysteine S-methyltransferase/methylenetetrahydrofolate reductase, partial [Thermomicrobiales bacterium]|nr:bifunctional homocysteine S-methyltransferase/methylenetetrahydrofolate reductase [Thermomicrobiales bacterium]